MAPKTSAQNAPSRPKLATKSDLATKTCVQKTSFPTKSDLATKTCDQKWILATKSKFSDQNKRPKVSCDQKCQKSRLVYIGVTSKSCDQNFYDTKQNLATRDKITALSNKGQFGFLDALACLKSPHHDVA